MALFTDGGISAVSDLVNQDASVLDVSNTLGINLTSKLILAQNEVEVELDAIFQRSSSIYTPILGQAPLDTNHLAVTTPLKLWHTYLTLALVYRDAFYTEMNQRYQAKYQEFTGLARWAMQRLIETGVGIVIDPLPQATAPVFSTTAGNQAGGTFYCSVSFVNVEGEEGLPSVVTSTTVPDGNILAIGATNSPANATGWNAYVGPSPSGLTLQNSTPVAIGQTWQYVPNGVTTGALPGTGQIPNVSRVLPRMLQRG